MSVTKPVSVWNKPLKANFKDLFINLSKSTIHGFTGQWSDLPSDFIDVFSTLGLKTKPEELAYILVRNSLAQAIWELVSENANELYKNKDKAYKILCDSLDLSLENKNLTINRSFFEHPGQLTLLEEIKIPFVQWLNRNGFSVPSAMALADRLRSYFIYSLNKEWGANYHKYTVIKENIVTPFTSAGEKELAWEKYNAWLQKQVDEMIFGEKFSIRQIYVDLRAYYIKKSKRIKVLCWLKDSLREWLDKADPNDAIRIISGGPGSGKSAFSKLFASEVSRRSDIKVLYIPLYLFNLTGDVIESIGTFLRETELMFFNPLDKSEEQNRFLLIFDGLDELSMQGKVGTTIAKNFLEAVLLKVKERNLQKLNMQVLISGRELIIQDTEALFRSEKQILNLIPFYICKDDYKEYLDDKNILMIDQREIWWKQYFKLKNLAEFKMPEELKKEEFKELTSHPLLNYLVALSYSLGVLKTSDKFNLNVLYKNLIEAVYERNYEKGRQYLPIHHLEKDDFESILEEIGLATWHGDGRSATVAEILKHCEQSGLKYIFETFQEGAKCGVTSFLSAFYFRKYGINIATEPTFEFTHKSFGEYLASKRIVRSLKILSEELETKKRTSYKGKDERECLINWGKICGPSEMSFYLYKFLKREIQLIKKEEILKIQNFLNILINKVLINGMPMKLIISEEPYIEMRRQSRNSEESLLAALNACIERTESICNLAWINTNTASSWLHSLIEINKSSFHSNFRRYLSYINFKNQSFQYFDFVSANLMKSDFKDANLMETNLRRANLRGANLRGANLMGANLIEANFLVANLMEANLRGANLLAANLMGANLKAANLRGADLRGANLLVADLKGADLSEVDLIEIKNFSLGQLSTVKSLYQAKLDSELREQIENLYPQLLEMPEDVEEEK